MLTRISHWMMIAGATLMVGGLLCVPAMIERHLDIELVAVGSGLFALGALAIASGFYLKAQVAQAEVETLAGPKRRMSGGCELCATEFPVVRCKVHQLDLCGHCLTKHYDFRSCAYVPVPRSGNPAGRSVKAHSA